MNFYSGEKSIALLLSLTFLVVGVACNAPITPKAYSLKDSAVKVHLAEVASQPHYDTSSKDFRLLRAYVTNDTEYFKYHLEILERDKSIARELAPRDSALELVPLYKLGADEAYQFGYYESFNQHSIALTITKREDSINLQKSVVFWNNSWSIQKVEQTNRKLSIHEWESFKESLTFADFWGLKEENGHQGLDGNSLNVSGFDRRYEPFPPKAQSVYRWSAKTTSLILPFRLLCRFANVDLTIFRQL